MAGLTEALNFIPFRPEIGGVRVNVHLVLEYLAFFVAFRYYVYLRKKRGDQIPTSNRLSIIIGAVFGALIGSRVMAFLEDPVLPSSLGVLEHFNNKTIMGGLFGGLLGVEIVKKWIGEKQSSGDLFTLPLILGILIGRVGCFLAGTEEFTYGKETGFILGMDLGDGLQRHPLALYEIVFLLILFCLFQYLHKRDWSWKPGGYFILFMLCYFGFRFFLEFLKPNTFWVAGLSSIQILSIICFLYYSKSIREIRFHARK